MRDKKCVGFVVILILTPFDIFSVDFQVSLSSNSVYLEFECAVNWQAEHQFLKVEFPVAIRSARATYEFPDLCACVFLDFCVIIINNYYISLRQLRDAVWLCGASDSL